MFAKIKKHFVAKVVETKVKAITDRYVAMLTIIIDRLPIIAGITAEVVHEHEDEIKEILEKVKPILEDLSNKLEAEQDRFKANDKELVKLTKGMGKDIEKLMKMVIS